jgi:D-alanyl-D-alanine carboxypeptidase
MKKLSFYALFSILFLGIIVSFISSRMFFPGSSNVLSPLSQDASLTKALHRIDVSNPNAFRLIRQQSFVSKAYATNQTEVFDQATEYIAIDNQSGNILLEKNAQYPVSIASLTKIMTSVVALDLAKSTDSLTVSSHAANEIPTTIGVVAGQQMTVDELLHAVLMTSANDAAQAVKDGIDAKYGSPVFIAAMNEKAKFLGLKHTHFANPQGFDNKANYSSAEDLAVLTHYALTNYSEIASITRQDFLHIDANTQHKQFDLNNWNGLLDVYPGVYGVKIGNTGGAGYTTVVGSQREGKDVLIILLNAPGILERDEWAAQLLDRAFGQFGITPANITEDDLRAKYATWKYYQ